MRLAGRFRESPSAAFAMKLRFGANGGHMLPWFTSTGAAQSWILSPYFECLAYAFLDQDLAPRNNRDEIDKVRQSNYHGNPSVQASVPAPSPVPSCSARTFALISSAMF